MKNNTKSLKIILNLLSKMIYYDGSDFDHMRFKNTNNNLDLKLIYDLVPVQKKTYSLVENLKYLNIIGNKYCYYDKTKIKLICEKKKENLMTFSVTTCKRLDLFEKSMNSFINCCTDISLIDK